MAEPTETPDAPGPRSRAPLFRLRTWIVGLVVVGVGAAVTQAVSGGLTAGASSVWDRIAGEPAPLTVDATHVSGDTSGFYFALPVSRLAPRPLPTSAGRPGWRGRAGSEGRTRPPPSSR